MSNVPLPIRSCIVTYMGDGRGLHYTLGVAAGTALIEQPPGSQLDLYTADQMHAYAAAVSAAKDKEIERLRETTKALYEGTMRQAAEIAQLRAELIKSLADNAALRADAIDRQNNVVAPLRERVRVLEDARPEPDCRLCRNFCDCSDHGYLAGWCKEGNQYDPLPPVRLWRTT